MITSQPVYSALVPRQTNPLSQLISEGIEVGNSILSELIGSTPGASGTTSTSNLSSASSISTVAPTFPTSTSSPTTLSAVSSSAASPSSTSSPPTTSGSLTSQSALLPASTTPASPAAFSQSSTTAGTNKSLIIGLAVAIGVLALAAVITGLCCWRRRLRRKREKFTRFEKGEPKFYPAADEGGLHATSDWECNPPVPEPTLPILRSLTIRSSRYKPLDRITSPRKASAENPFLSPAEMRLPSTALTSHQNSYASQSSSEKDKSSSERESMLVSPMVPVEGPSDVPVEVEGDTGSLLERHSKPRSPAIWPSRADSLKFDFGFGMIKDKDPRSDEAASFKVPRRPVGGRYR